MSTTIIKRVASLGLALLIAVFSTNIVPAMSAYAAANGNNGTLKVHEKGTPSGTESNDPKVCIFNFEGFGLDANQSGDISITTQGGPSDDTILLTIPLSTDASGNGVTSPYVNDAGSVYTLANGHYKATLDNKFGLDNGNKAKSKVFKVTCAAQPTTATPDVTIIDSCGTANDSVAGADVDGVNYTVTSNGLVYTVVASPVTGYSLTAGNGFTLNNDGTATRTVTLTNVNCPQTVTPCDTTTGPTVITVDSQFADSQDTRSAGHYEFISGGLKIYTDDSSSNAKVAWYHGVDYSLANVGAPAMDYDVTSGIAPGLQLAVDFDNNGTIDGILVGESAYGNDWWLTGSAAQFVKDGAPSHSTGYGSLNHGTLDQWLTNFPTAQVKAIGFSLGSGVHASGVLHSLTFGCHVYTFDKPLQPVTPADPTAYDYCYNDQDYVYIPWSRNVTYKINGDAVSGWVSYDGTPITVTAEANDGYVIEKGAASSWTFDETTFTNEQCISITKSAKTATDTNHDGIIGIGDTVTWEVTVTNNSDKDYESFYVTVDDPGTTLEDDGYIGYLGAGDSRTLTATSTIDFVDFNVCTITNTATFKAWRANQEERVSLLDESDNIQLDEPAPLATGTASAEYTYTCPTPGKGSITPTTPTDPAPKPAELPHTGPSDDKRLLLIGIVAAILTYGAVYFTQPKKFYEQ